MHMYLLTLAEERLPYSLHMVWFTPGGEERFPLKLASIKHIPC